ncbi:hypothetical protein RchiOBHm_Chr2g0092371 [Rosa chinensis]|uniref:Uncharacterized protein n=1 Tax=Rosa chinensis TaxID=74649 RepID=A0A2P6RJZ1_ROSCH|nr:hypothetical protein RchiOBHm_Chr2g0092371 [Rosa chinensis]
MVNSLFLLFFFNPSLFVKTHLEFSSNFLEKKCRTELKFENIPSLARVDWRR